MSDWDDSDFEPDAPAVAEVRRRLMVEEVRSYLIETVDVTSESESESEATPSTSIPKVEPKSVICEGRTRVHAEIKHEPSITQFLSSIIMSNRYFPIQYLNIIEDFADVEIFLISLDSLIIECLNHKYHNRKLGSGQSLVLCHQIYRFLDKLTSIGGKFKLVLFTDMNELFKIDSHLNLARTIVIENITHGTFAKDLIYFMSPYDPSWYKFLGDMTPSFIMISMEDPIHSPSVRLATHFATIMWNCLTSTVTVVLFNSLSINFKTVMAYRLIGYYYRFNEKVEKQIEELWNNESVCLNSIKFPPTNISTIYDLWVYIISETRNSQQISTYFDILASSILLTAFVSMRRGVDRVYPPSVRNAEPCLNLNDDCEKITRQATVTLQLMDCKSLEFSLKDFWDGRMILTLFEYIKENKAVLPASLQEEFECYRTLAGIQLILPVDNNDKLLKKIKVQVRNRLLEKLTLFPMKSSLLESYVPEVNLQQIEEEPQTTGYETWFAKCNSWIFGDIPETLKPEYVFKTERERTWENRNKQTLMRWYELFATSLEGRGNLQVDFTRVSSVGLTNTEERETSQKGWAGQRGNGGKKGKIPNKAKEIREANLKAKEQKILEDEKIKINHALQQGKQTVFFLERLYDSLQRVESKALCVLEMAKSEAERIIQEYKWTGTEKLEEKRYDCLELVGYIKDCFVKQWQFLDEQQQQQVVDLWYILGFIPPSGMQPSGDLSKKLDLKMEMIYYFMEHGGQLVDIQSDPIKDNRVTGFAPDEWQRRMLDTVDKGNSALIVAPTSAGKTFVSFYCMEKILRASDYEVVVFVSPEKALMNQVCGSVYARFKSKVMSKGKTQFGVLHPDYNTNALNCQILVTVAECLEHLLLSTDSDVQEFVSRIRYVIFDEVHSIGVSNDSHMWEHLFLLIRCPFLALSATVGNITKLYKWLSDLEKGKTEGKRKVDLIQYNERYSELELSIINIKDPRYTEHNNDIESPLITSDSAKQDDLVQSFMPYGVFAPEKLRIFGIPEDQQLTAKQILQLYRVMAKLDKNIRIACEPNTFFGYTGEHLVWISRSRLRELENKLKETFLQWVHTDEEKLNKALDGLRAGTISQQLEYRSGAFSSDDVADTYISQLVDELQTKNMLPAICFNDDGDMCEMLAENVADELKTREEEYMETAEYKNLDNAITRDDTKLTKAAKRQRDAEDKRKKGKKAEEADDRDKKDTVDPLEKQKAMREEALQRFKLRALKNRDQDLYKKAIERLSYGKERESTKLLISLIERGVAFHHARMTSNQKKAVEILFRAGYLAVLFSTKTLALGVNMPCKTVIFGIDTFFLTPLMYRQMSGRAGRRGFDHKGNVIFMGIPTKKMRRLLTASLSNLEGNPPFDTTFILRLLSYVHQKKERGIQTTQEERNKVALSVLNNYFSLYTQKEADTGVLQKQIQQYFVYSVQFLRRLQLLDENCSPQYLSSLSCILHKFAPGNLIIVHLIQKGVLHRMCTQFKDNKDILKYKLITLLAILFTRVRMPPNYLPKQRKRDVGNWTRCLVHLPDIPADIAKHIEEYNQNAILLFERVMGINVRDPVIDVTGTLHNTTSLFATEHLVSPIIQEYSHDDSFLPILPFNNKGYNGRKIYYNAYAVDLFLYQERSILSKVHRLASGSWYYIHDFVQVLRLLSSGLSSVGSVNDPVCAVIRELYEEYNNIFITIYEMKNRY